LTLADGSVDIQITCTIQASLDDLNDHTIWAEARSIDGVGEME